jgi:hypothetical protein
MKIRPVGTQLFHAGGRTDMTKLTNIFLNFANAPKIASEMMEFADLYLAIQCDHATRGHRTRRIKIEATILKFRTS